MDEPSDIGGSRRPTPASGWRNVRSAALAILRRLAHREAVPPKGHAAPGNPGRDLELLHDLRWEITDDAQRHRENPQVSRPRPTDTASASINEMREARDAAIEASHAKTRFLAYMSHEIRTPMNGILGVADLLLDERLTDEQRTYVQTIANSARALTSLIDEILDLSRIEAGKLVLAHDAFSIRDAVESCLGVLRPNADAKRLSLESHIGGDVPLLVAGDETRMRQVLLNLVSNAIKFTNAGRVRVEVSADVLAGTPNSLMIRLAVVDTGIGLSAADCIRIFDEFEQAEPRASRDGGSGLGLAIARQIARAMGGDIRVDSEPGKGSTFTAELKVSQVDRAPAREMTKTSTRCTGERKGRTGKARVLLAEDNAVNALLATRLLEREGCEVVAVRTGDAAVTAIARSLANDAPLFDLVLMDIYMPRLDGLEATRAIRRLMMAAKSQEVGRLPVVAVTASLFAQDRQHYLASGMDDVLAKPFDAQAVKLLLDRWLPRSQSQLPTQQQTPAA